jgi:two-component system sensor kinase FixL
VGDTVRADQALQRAMDQVTRAGDVIQRLRQFVRKDGGHRAEEDVRQMVEEAAALAMLGAERRRARLVMDFASDLPSVLIDKVQIQQVLLNLIRNAIEAMQDSSRRELTIGAKRASCDWVEISVADSGPGLPKTVREKLFQPFVTTKPSGMGVGLSICHDIIEGHGGRMWLAETPGGGATFCFTLPVAGRVGVEARA